MKRILVLAVATAFAAPAFAQVGKIGGGSSNIGAGSGDIIGLQFGSTPRTPEPIRYDRRSTAWLDNGTRRLGDLLAAKYLAMEKMAEAWWTRRVNKHYQYATRAPARA